MKRRLFGIMAALGLALGLSTAAQAQTALQTITKNGVTCSQYSSGFGSTYPTSMWDCANPTSPGNDISAITQPALNLQTSPTNLKSSLANVQLYLFKNAANYASYTGATAPAANAFGATTTNLAAAFTTATQNGASVDLTSDIGGSIVEQLGHFNDAAQATPFSSNTVFTTALAYDEAYMNSLPNNIWPSAYYTKYPGKTNWQIFQAIYPNANTDIFNYQFMSNISTSAPSDLYNVLVNDMPNTRGWVKNYVFLSTPANPAVAKNGVLCVQQFTGFGTYPTSMWDCLSPYNAGNEVSAITQSALNLQTTPTNLKASLASVQLYAFKNAANYVSFTGATAPAANAFGATTTNLAAAFASTVQNGVTVDLTGDFSGSILEELGHFNDAAQATPFSSNVVFTTALAYDEAYMNSLPNNVWPSAYYTKYPGKTNWQIFQAIYPNANTDIFNYQFMTNTNSTSAPSDLYNVLVNDMPNTRGWVKNYVFLATPANPAVAKNGVLCVQQFTGFAPSYPAYMWDCLTPYNPGNEVSNITQPPLNLQSNLKASISNVDLYAFANAANFASFTGATAPAANAFGGTTTNLAAAFASATQNGVKVDLTGDFGSSIIQELGHIIDVNYGNLSASTAFANALSADITYLNAETNAWPTAYHTKYPSDTNWQILQAVYPSAATDIFDYQFMVFDNQSTVSDLNTVLVNYMPNTKAYMNNLFGSASATVPSQCTLVSGLTGGYPNGYYDNCLSLGVGTENAFDSTLVTSAQALPSATVNRLQGAGVKLFYVEASSVANSEFGTTNGDTGGFAYGSTQYYLDQGTAYILIYKYSNYAPPSTTVTTTAEKQGAQRHEVGHVIDQLNGFPSGETSGVYRQLLQRDFANIDAMAPCTVFANQTDPRAGHGNAAICVGGSLAPAYQGNTNSGILKLILPYYFTMASSGPFTGFYVDTFAEGFAVKNGGGIFGASTGYNPDYYLTNFFPCSGSYVSALGHGTTLPNAPTVGGTGCN